MLFEGIVQIVEEASLFTTYFALKLDNDAHKMMEAPAHPKKETCPPPTLAHVRPTEEKDNRNPPAHPDKVR